MNNKQWAVLLVAVGLFSLSELFPPWLYEYTWTSAERSAGYHFILGPEPKIKSPAEMRKLFSIPDAEPLHSFSVREDIIRLYGQRLSLLFLMTGLLLTLGERPSLLQKLLGIASVSIGVGFLGLYVWYVFPMFG